MQPLDKVAQTLASYGQHSLAREVRSIASSLKTAADEIQVTDLPADKLRFARSLEKIFGKITQVWDGVHGNIVTFEGRGVQNARLTKDTLRALLASPDFRWVDADDNSVSVGM